MKSYAKQFERTITSPQQDDFAPTLRLWLQELLNSENASSRQSRSQVSSGLEWLHQAENEDHRETQFLLGVTLLGGRFLEKNADALLDRQMHGGGFLATLAGWCDYSLAEAF